MKCKLFGNIKFIFNSGIAITFFPLTEYGRKTLSIYSSCVETIKHP